MSDHHHYGANWGWVMCRAAVMKVAVQRFTSGDDEAAQLLRSIAANELVIRKDTLKDAPIEHCAHNCECKK